MIASRSEGQSPSTASTKRFRSACDYCHDTKVKCSGTKPCEKCEKIGFDCTYSVSNRMGRPKDTRNKKTLERVRQSQEAKAAREAREAEGARSLDAERTSMQTMPVVGPCRVDLTAEEALSLDGASLDIGLGVVNHAMSREATTLTSSSNDTRMSGLDMLSDTDSFSPLHISNDPKAPGGMDDFWNLDVSSLTGDPIILFNAYVLIAPTDGAWGIHAVTDARRSEYGRELLQQRYCHAFPLSDRLRSRACHRS